MTLAIGDSVEVQGSAAKPYLVKNHDGVIWSCSCPAWRNSGGAVERKTCKHIRQVAGAAAEAARLAGGPIQATTVTQNQKVAITPLTTAKQEIIDRAASQGRKLRQDEKTALNGPPVLLAHSWNGETDPTGYLLSEKRDGVRSYYVDGNFVSRQGNVYKAPEWFKAGLGDQTLDGELVIGDGRKKFSETISIVKRLDAGDAWKAIRFEVFDAPNHPGGFEERIAYCREALANAPYAMVLDQTVCTSVEHLKQELARIEALGGEGVMLRKSGSTYEAGRSHTLLKVKSFFDCEAEIIGFLPGKGKFKGMVGSFECKLKSGVTFSVGSGIPDSLRKAPPVIGTDITVRYQELSKDNVPRFPVYVAVRDYE